MTILFIDDDPDNTELYCEAVSYLNKSDYFFVEKNDQIECLTLNHPVEAIDFILRLKQPPEYIFLDINMPGMDGEECLINLKSNEKLSNTPVIMLSTICGDHEEKKFRELGARDCIQKPAGFNQLIKVFSKYIYQKGIH